MTVQGLCRGAALATVIAGGATVAAQAQAAPIRITSCTILRAQPTHQRFWYPYGPIIAVGAPVADGVRIRYVNTAPIAADRIVFLVNYRGDVQRVIDVGTFSPNAPIDHAFGNFSGDAFLGVNPNSCVTRAVRFVNRTVWRAH